MHEEGQQRQVVHQLDGEDDVLPTAAEDGEHSGEDRGRPRCDRRLAGTACGPSRRLPRWHAIVGIRYGQYEPVPKTAWMTR